MDEHGHKTSQELLKFVKALVLLQVNGLGAGVPRKPEVLLAKAGFAHRDIAEMLGKSQMAVSKAISRSKNGEEGVDDE